MSIVKLNNRSVKDITAFGSISSLGSLTHIATQTASSSASVSFTSGIDSTYKEYIFYFVNIHPSGASTTFGFNGSIDSGSNYNVTKTSTYFHAAHNEADTATEVALGIPAGSLAQSTGDQILGYNISTANDECGSGYLHLFNPSSTFVKHYISNTSVVGVGTSDPYEINSYTAGYFNTTSAIDAVQFKMSSGNIDSGQILLFGLN